ncbi:putative transcriptional regulator [Bacillus sp. TS-2]|nr:putative transcriptional regulator [Bacillus sp. TS-2]
MSYDSIKNVALKLFSEHGYEGASLAQIAERVGIKKQSIYSHFKSKDALFLQLLNETFLIEQARIKNYLEIHMNKPLYDCLLQSLESYIERFSYDHHLKFFLRASFFPPNHLYAEVMKALYDHIDHVDELYMATFKKAYKVQNINQLPQTATLAFSALIDSILVELVYGGEARTRRKLEATWMIFWKGLTTP